MTHTTLPSVLLLSVAAACGGDDSAATGQGQAGGAVVLAEGEPVELMGITGAHNDVRAQVGVPPVAWDNELANIAQGWADRCQFEHNAGRSDDYHEYVGENLYMAGGFVPTAGEVVESWASEETDYDYDTNSCSGVCGHYTQVVWADSTHLGCGSAECGGRTIVVCNYAPGGNLNGQRPY